MKKIIILIILLSMIITIPKENNKTIYTKYKTKITNMKILNIDDNIGFIKIDKIHLNNKLYNIDNKKNNVEENVTILKESTFPYEKDSTLILAAHSGRGKIAYFNELDKLEKNDLIDINLYNKDYQYRVESKWEDLKNGTIRFPISNEKQLILTTCSTKNKNNQLIIYSTLKKSS